MSEFGKVRGFEVGPFLECADILMRSDESERALSLLSNLPAHYRDYPPPEVCAMRDKILYSLLTPHSYASVDMDADVGKDVLDTLQRGVWLKELVHELNEKGVSPHIIDVGPGEYWLPIGLYKRGYSFTYHDVGLLQRTAKVAREMVPASMWQSTPPLGQPSIFVAFEIIEHLSDPLELAIEAMRHNLVAPDYVFLSTPLYTFDTKENWDTRGGQPHRRAYTPREFFTQATAIFPGYNWDIRMDSIQIVKGTRDGI